MAKQDRGGISAGDIANVASAHGSISLDISGDVKQSMLDFISVANRMVSGSKLGQYFGTTEQLAKRLANAVRLCNEDFKQFRGFDSANAKEVVNTFNALTASANGADVSSFFKGVEGGFRGVMSTVEAVQAKIGKFTEGFSEADFSRMFGSFQQIKDWADTLGLGTKEVENLMASLSQLSGTDVSALTQQLANAQREITSLKEQLSSATSGRMFKELQAEIDNLQSSLRRSESMLEELRTKATIEFRDFLSVNMIDPDQTDEWGLTRFQDYFNGIQQGTMTAREAITRFKVEYQELFENVDPDRGLFNVSQVEEFTAKLEQIFVRVEEIGTYIQNTTANAPGMLANAVEKDIQNINKEEQALRHVIDEGGQLGQVGQIVNNIADASANGTQKMGEMSEQTVKLVDSFTALGSAGEESLTAISAIFRNIGTIKDLDVNTDQFKKLKEALEILQGTTGLEKIGLLSNVNLQGFSNLKISTTIGHLATYLPPLSRDVDIGKLQALSLINLSNFSADNLKVSKASMDHIRELIAQISGKPTQIVNNGQTQQLAEEQTAVERLNTTYKEHSDAVSHAIADEQQKAVISTELTAKLQSEKEAMDAVSGSAERGAASGQKYSAVWDKMFLGKFVAEFAKVKAQFDALEDKPAKLADNMRKLEAAENDMRAATNMKDRVDASERFVTILDVVRTQIGAVNAEAKNSNADFKSLLTLLKQSQSAIAGIENSSFTNKLKDMTQKVGNIADESVIRNLKEMRQAYVDMQSAYGTAGPNTEQDYQALINAQIRWKNALAGLNQALATNRTEVAATNAASKESAQTAKQIVDGAEQAATQIKNLNAVFESLRDKTKFDTSSFEQMRTLLAQVNDTSLSNDQRQSALQQLNDLIKQNTENLRGLAAAEKAAATAKKQSDAEDKQKATLIKQLNSLLDQCTKAEQRYAIVSKAAFARDSYKGIQETKESVRQLLQQLDGTDPKFDEISASVRRAQTDFSNFNTTLKTGGGVLSNYLTTGMSQLKSRLTYTLGLAATVYKAVGEIKKMVSTAVELDSAMNTLQIVTRASGDEMDEYSKRVSSMAKETAQSTKDLINATTVYARLGYSMDESSVLSKYTAMLQSVGDIDASSAQNAITAIIKAFSKGVDDIEDVMDKMVLVGNNFPISVSQIAEGMNNAGSMLNVAGNSFEESIALLTAANSTIQNISKASTGLRTIAARIRKTTTGEDDDGEIVEEAKYQEMINALTKHRVSLIDAETKQYRSTYEIIKDIAAVWGKMTSMEQAAVVEALAGTRQQNIFASLMTQFGTAEDAVEQMKDSAGELQEAYNIRMESIQAHINQLKAAFDELSMKVVNSDLAKGAIDIVTRIIEGLTALIDKIGGVGVALSALGGIAAIKFLTGGGIAGLILDISKLAVSLSGIAALIPELAIAGGAVLAIIGLVAGIKNLKKAYDEANPSFELSKKLLADAGKTIDDLTSKIDTNNQRIHALEEAYKNGDFTVVEEAELTRLEVENQLLEAQLELQKKIQAERQKQVHEAAVNTANTLLGNNSEENPFAQTIQNAVDNYRQAQKDLEDAKAYLEKRGEDATTNDETYVNVAMYNLEQRSAELNNVLNKIAEVTAELDPEEDKDLIDDLTEAVADFTKTLDGTSKKTKKWQEDLKALEKTYGSNVDALKKLARGEELTRAEGERLRRWMHDCGYDAKELAELLSQMGEELSEEQGETEGGNGYLDAQISKWGTMTDEIERAKKAIEDYNNAMSGGNNGDMAAQMEEAWKKAVEDIDSGRIDSRAVWAFAEMAMTPQQLADLEFDAARIADAIKGSFYQEMFKDEDNDDGYSYGQRLLFQLEKNLDHLNGVSVWEDETGLHYWIEDFAALADQLKVSEGFLDAFLDDLDAYGSQLLTDTKQNTELINTFLDIKDKATDAREAMKEFIAVSFNNDKDMSDMTMARILKSLHDQGFLDIDPSEYYKVIGEVREENEKLEEDNPVVTPELNAEPLENDINNMRDNIQSFLDNNPLVVSISGRYTNLNDVGSTEENFGDSKVSNKQISMGGHYTKSSAIGKRPGQDGGDTLVNELGPELISDNGRAFIANGGKPGFVRLSDNAIVFTANETKDILKGKRNVNAKAYAAGNVGRGSLISRLVQGNVPAHAYIRCPVCGTANPDSRASCYSCGASLHGGSAASVNNSRGTTGSSNAGVNRSAYGSPTAVTSGQNMGGNGYYYSPTTQTITYTTYTYDENSGLGYGNVNDYGSFQSMEQAARRAQEKLEAELYKAKQRAIQDANRQKRADFLANDSGNKLSGSGGGNHVGGSDYGSSSDPQKVDWIAVRINRLQRTIADLEKVASSGFKKLDKRLSATKEQIKKTSEEISDMDRAYYRYMAEADSVGLSSDLVHLVREGAIDINEYDDETREKIDQYTEW